LYASVPFDVTADRLRSALSGEVADQLFREMEVANARQLPAGILEHRALALAAQGAPAAAIIGEIAGYHRALWLGRETLRAGGRSEPVDAEVEAAGILLQKGIDAEAVIIVIQTAPAERPLEVPLLVAAALLDRGLPTADVAAVMQVWLAGNASDEELLDLAGPLQRPELTVLRNAHPTSLHRRPRH
jgi:hypothetical protein